MKLNLLLYKLENKIRRFSIEKLMQIISVVMLAVFAVDTVLALSTDGQALSLNAWLSFDRNMIMRGQVWRIISFIFVYPTGSNVLFTLLGIYFFYWTGNAVEGYWGKARFNLYYLFGIIGTIVAGFIVGYIDNLYLNLSIFLAFATMFPDTQVMLFFIIPIKVKWLGIAEGVLLALLFIIGSWADRAAIIAAILNFLLFFGSELINRTKGIYRDYKWRNNNYRY